ncbi:hypothetical protein [Vibrio sp. D431a]|uniref:hypothetical protein n=1 Tax=Vibrio sp. D431a TaxID=2837388 RepID=UPI0025547307|nr:hypothetical protein [Vibrio sp. D431a]MDK9789998.1 hypothetical protein [Vibrio sp. D431a]
MSGFSKHGGVEHLLKLLDSGKDVLVKAYVEGTVTEDFNNAGRIAKLCEGRALIRTARGYRVHPKLEGFFNYFLETEASQYLNTQHAERIPEISELCDRYLELKLKGSNKKLQDDTFDLLEAVVYELIMDLTESCRRLRARVEDDFGYGKTLHQKRLENEKAVLQAERLVKGLKSFSFRLLAEFASDCTEINSLLCGELYTAIRRCQADLEVTMERLRALMLKYREREKDRDLISSFDKFLDQEHEWVVDLDSYFPDEKDLEEQALLQKFHVAEGLELASCPDIDDCDQDDDLTSITEAMLTSSNSEREVKELKISEALEFSEEVDEREVELEEIESHCDNLFTKVFETESSMSAVDYYNSIESLNSDMPLQCDLDVWLFGVMSFYGAMTSENKETFICEGVGERTYKPDGFTESYGNTHIEDVIIEYVE